MVDMLFNKIDIKNCTSMRTRRPIRIIISRLNHIKNIHYADDTILMIKFKGKLKELLDKAVEERKKKGLLSYVRR